MRREVRGSTGGMKVDLGKVYQALGGGPPPCHQLATFVRGRTSSDFFVDANFCIEF